MDSNSNGKYGASAIGIGSTIDAHRSNSISDSINTNEEYQISSKGLEILGSNVLNEKLAWHSEPIYAPRKNYILGLIADLEKLGREIESPSHAWKCQELRANLERAISSAEMLMNAIVAAESGYKRNEIIAEEKRSELETKIIELDRQIDEVEREIVHLSHQAHYILGNAGLHCEIISVDKIEECVCKSTPTNTQVAGELGIPFYTPKTLMETIISLPSELSQLAVGAVVGTALGLIGGFLTLRMIQDFTNILLLIGVFFLGAVVTGTIAEAITSLVRVWAHNSVKKVAGLYAQLDISKRLINTMIITGVIFIGCEALLEALGFLHLHNLIAIQQMRLASGASKVAVQTEMMSVATPIYFCLGFVISAPLILMKVSKALHGIQVGLSEDFISSHIQQWKEDKRKQVVEAIALASDCGSYREKSSKLSGMKIEKETEKKRISASVANAQHNRIQLLEIQARGKAGKFWELFEAAVQAPEPVRIENNNHFYLDNNYEFSAPTPKGKLSWIRRASEWLKRHLTSR